MWCRHIVDIKLGHIFSATFYVFRYHMNKQRVNQEYFGTNVFIY